MSLTCPTTPIFHTSIEQKLKSRNAAKVYRYGSPKLRDLLREKCRIRAKEARQTSLEKCRNLSQTLAYHEILRQELAELEQDIDLQEKIYQEVVDEANEWFTDQLEEEQEYMINVGDSDAVLCPICQRSGLESIKEQGEQIGYRCQCKQSFLYSGDLNQLRSVLSDKIDAHEGKCLKPLVFYVEPSNEGNHLCAMCVDCDYFGYI